MGISRFDASSATTMSAPRQTGIWRAGLTALLFLAGSLEALPSGPVVADPKGQPLKYGRADLDFRVPAFIAWGDRAKIQAV